MATIEKLIKAFEALKVFQSAPGGLEEITSSAKKKDQPPSKKDKMVNCNVVADCICAVNMRSVPDFPKFLGIAVEAFLTLCDDPESDIRMVADECLNRTIKTLLETNLGRLQVELYKEIKKNGSSRTLRGALWRFADMCHLIRPLKCRPYIVNLLPCLTRISQRDEEAIQDTLGTSMSKICPALMGFANDGEVKSLLKTFLPNLKSTVAVCRRTTATSLVLICQYSRNPLSFFNYLISVLLEMVLPVDTEHDIYTLLGVILCLRHAIPIMNDSDEKDQGMKGSFGLVQNDKEEGVSSIQVEKIFQLLLFYTSHSDHNVVTASLEALQQLLRHPPDSLRSILLVKGSISRTHIFQQDFIDERERMRVESSAELTSEVDDQGLEEDADVSMATDQPIKSNTATLDEDIEQVEDLQLDSSSQEVIKDSDENGEKLEPAVHFTTDNDYSNLDIGDLNDDKSEKTPLTRSGSQDTLLSVKSLSPRHSASARTLELAQDLNGNPEYIETSEPASPMPISDSNKVFQLLADFGNITDHEMPLVYCVRLLCRRFLLNGNNQELILDKFVRVSSKSLALACISSAIFMCPKIFLLKLLPTDSGDQDIREVTLYASHPDPVLKGQTAIVISSFIKAVLIEGRGDFNKWLKMNSPADIGEICIDNLVNTIIHVIEDESSVATRQGLIALQSCLASLLDSCHGGLGLQVLLDILQVRNNPYWLVKVELLEVLSSINFKVVSYLENICEEIEIGKHHYLGKLEIQEYYVQNVVLCLLADEDIRVRNAAANSLVKLIPNLFYPVDHPQHDPVTACAQDSTTSVFTSLSHQLIEDLPPLVQGLVKPYHYSPNIKVNSTVESCLSRIIQQLLHQIHISQSRYLLNGCCHALCLLCEEYTVTCYSSCWGCGPATHISTKDHTRSGSMKRPPSRSLSSSSSFSLEELSSATGSGPLPMILSILMSSPVGLDISSHQDVLQLTGNLMAGSAFKCLRSSEELASLTSTGDAGKWAAISDVQLGTLIDQLLVHVARLMNCFLHVFEEQIPGPPQIKPSLPSLPNAPSLSPVKRKVKGGDKETASPSGKDNTTDSKTPQKTPQKDTKEGEKEKGKKEGLGTFYNLPQYMKLFDVLKGAYSNYKTSLDLSNCDKFCNLLKVTLSVLAQILEVTTLIDIGKYAEEFLTYFKCTFSIEPTFTVLCVQQLLKALFGTNIGNQWEPGSVSNYTSQRVKHATRQAGSNFKPGLYQCCLNQPYTTLTKSLESTVTTNTDKTQSETDTNHNTLLWLKKRVERKVPSILKPGSKVDKSAIASYIRLFEPLVIKALKQYTVTSSLDLQHQVLNLLAQLVQLRVNYCLLDSDQIFIGFVLKQFEYIEEGQIRESEMLIPHIFRFLVMLSYERFPGKVIIDMNGVIHRCDGIMASGLQPTKHAIPALRPIVYDLFLLRGNVKTEVGKEQDTQREVVVSMLLRLINYHQALEMFVIVLQQCHRESEEKWKKLSRQVMDLVLPALSKQQINLDCSKALDVLHLLFESVSPSVFRPVDILLKTLLAPPTDISCVEGLQRWLCVVLAILRIIISQSKEETVLSRLLELNLPLCLTRDLTKPNAEPVALTDINPEETFAWFLLQAVGLCSEILNRESAIVSTSQTFCDFTVEQMSHLLLYITYMFQSGSYRRVATAAMRLINRDRPSCLYSVKEINNFLLGVSTKWPTLALHWSNILILLNYDNQKLWTQILQTPQKYHIITPGRYSSGNLESSRRLLQCCNLEILRRGGLILYCDYVVENLSNAEHMTWLTVNHVSDLIELTSESPVQDFISAIHRNPAASSMFVQAINSRCDHVTRPSLIRKTLKSLEAIHLSQSGSLLQLLIDKFLNTHQLSIARMCDTIACRRVEMLLVESEEESKKQLPLEDLDKLLQFMKTNNLIKRHARLASLLSKFRTIFNAEKELHLSPERTHPLVFTSTNITDIKVDKHFYSDVVKDQCFSIDPNVRECAFLLQRLDYADILAITMTKEFCLEILDECIALGAFRSIIRYNRDKEALPISFKPEPTVDELFQAAQLTMFRHINNIINHLPVPHQLLSYSRRQTSKNLRYYDRIEDLFTDCTWFDMNFDLATSLCQYLVCVRRFPWPATVPQEAVSDICRFCVLCLEMISWQLHHNQMPTSEQLQTCLECVALVLQNKDFTNIIGHSESSTYVSSITSAVYQLISSLVVLPGEKVYLLPHKDRLDEQEDDESSHLITSCDQISELLQCLKTRLRPKSSETQKLPEFLASPIRNIVTGLARLPLVNSYARVPPLVWKLGWSPSPTGNLKTHLPPVPVDYLQEKDVLEEFVFRINTLGWVSRHQFEETWMSLLGVLNPVTLTDTHQLSAEEEIERTQGMVLAVKSITSLLLQSTLIPQAGNPSNSVYEIRPRDKPLAFLHTRCGKKLGMIRSLIEQEIYSLCCNKSDSQTHHTHSKLTRRLDSYFCEDLFEDNLERRIGSEEFSLGQISLEGIWSIVGSLETTHSESDTTDSTESPQHDPKKPHIALSNIESKDRSMSINGLDINSCLQFISELYGPWLSTESSNKPPLMLLNAVVKSMLSLSDLFMEREQFEMMLDTFLDLYKHHPSEDEIISQYLIVGICKASAVIGVDSSTAERLIKIIDLGLKSTHLPSKVSSLHGILYILETSTSDLTKTLLPIITEFLTRHLSAISNAYITSDQFLLTMWATVFYILENYHEDIKDGDFPSRIMQLVVSTASYSEDSVSTSVFLTLMKGLERLLLADVLSKTDIEAIVKLSLDRLCLPSPQRALAALGLMFTCMYSGKSVDQYSPRPRDMEPSFTSSSLDVIYQDPESLILAMERVTVLFDRIRKGYPYEARVITRLLPPFLSDFFPPQDIMNKVIGEFLSSQQPYPQLIARVVFQVFNNLHVQNEVNLVRDWVMLSLSNFTQRSPIAMAIWSLTSFFISASTNPWLKSLFPHVVGRMGKMEVVDKRLFCLAALDFYKQLTDENQKRAFVSTFQSVVQPDTPYQTLLNSLS